MHSSTKLILALTSTIAIVLYLTANFKKPTASAICLNYVPFSIQQNPESDYYNWYGLQGTSTTGKKYLTGHVFERHLAANGACTAEQKQQNKTVFYNIVQFQKAALRIPALCTIDDHKTFTYSYDGSIAAPSDYINGIDCKTGKIEKFSAYFVQFKRAIRNSNPSLQTYLNSNYVTFWTFYPKRNTGQNSDESQVQKIEVISEQQEQQRLKVFTQ